MKYDNKMSRLKHLLAAYGNSVESFLSWVKVSLHLHYNCSLSQL